MKKIYFFWVIILIFLLSASINSNAKFTLQINNLADGYTVDVHNFPLFKAIIKGQVDGTDISLSKDNIIILEGFKSVQPLTVSPLQNGSQTITWATTAEEFGYYNFWMIYAVNNSDIDSVTASSGTVNYSSLRFKDINFISTQVLQFGYVPGNSQKDIQFYVQPTMSKLKPNGKPGLVMIDSLTFNSDKFVYDWQGHPTNMNKPPVGVEAEFHYLCDVYFNPKDDKYIRDKVTIHFDGGAKKSLDLIGNVFNIEDKTFLQLIQPNGGEKLVPCQDYTIKWKGNNLALPTIVEFSSNAGVSWVTISDKVFDSVYVWNVPNIPTNNALVRVRQDFNKLAESLLNGHNGPVMKLAYNSTGSKLLSVDVQGKIIEWNFSNNTNRTYNIQFIGNSISPIGIEYTSKDDKFAVAYNLPGLNKTYLSFFNANAPPSSQNTIVLPRSYQFSEMTIDSRQRYLAFVPCRGSELLLLNPTDGNIINTINYNVPIQVASFNQFTDTAAVALLNGKILLYSLPDWNVIKSFSIDDETYIKTISLSPNGKLIGLACKSLKDGTQTDIHVLDIESGMIVRSPQFTSSDAVSVQFSPASNMLLTGSEAQPQIEFWNLPVDKEAVRLGGHTGLLTDCKFSPEGHQIATSANSSDNLIIRSFTYPEQDNSDNFFRIVPPQVTTTNIIFEPTYLASKNTKIVSYALKNTGEVPVFFDNLKFSKGTDFYLTNPFAPVELLPNDSLILNIVFNPLDTGKLTDTIFVHFCTGLAKISLEGTGLKRNITFLQPNYDFGEVCINDALTKDIALFRNDDPVDLEINLVAAPNSSTYPFKVLYPGGDIILKPGGVFTASVQFTPFALGDVTGNILVYHSQQTKMVPEVSVKGKGIGTFVEYSHYELLFIPEILQRTITIKNTGDQALTIQNASINPGGLFNILTSLPFVVSPHSEKTLDLSWNGTTFSYAELSLKATPCLVQSIIPIRPYKANSTVTAVNVQADPRGEAVLPVKFINNENSSYKGTRFFEAEITINPRLFLPQSITSNYGTAKLTRNDIVSDRRIIGIDIEGDFPASGIVAEIRGIAGLAETDTSVIGILKNSVFWGSSVVTTTEPGLFQLTGLCGDRRIIQNNNSVQLTVIRPNPANEKVTFELLAAQKQNCIFEISDFLGNIVKKLDNVSLIQGLNYIDFDLRSLTPGAYKVTVIHENGITTGELIILR